MTLITWLLTTLDNKTLIYRNSDLYSCLNMISILQKLHKEKKHNIPYVRKKVQINDKHEEIDIEEVSKGPPAIFKEHTIDNFSIASHIQPPVHTNEKDIKQMMNGEGLQPNVTCSQCGEDFEYLSLLVQHYLHCSKGYQALHT